MIDIYRPTVEGAIRRTVFRIKECERAVRSKDDTPYKRQIDALKALYEQQLAVWHNAPVFYNENDEPKSE